MATDSTTAQSLIDQSSCLAQCIPSGMMPAAQLQATLNLANNPINIGTVTLAVSDIEIGAVELKNATTDDRAFISPAGALKVDGSSFTQPISGSVSVSNFPGQQHVIVDSGTLTAVTSITNPVAVTGTFWQATQPISAVSLPLPTGASTSALQTTGNTSLASIDAKLTNPLPVSGPATDANLDEKFGDLGQKTMAGSAPVVLASDQSVIKTITVLQDQFNPGQVAQVTLGGALSVNVLQVGGTNVPTGNGVTGSGSQRVTIASDNTAFAVNATLSAETTKVIGTVNQGTSPWVVSAASLPLPTGASTEATLAEIGADIDTIETNFDVALSTRLKPADTLTAVTTVSTVTSLTQMNGAAISMNTGVRDAGTQRVTIATNDSVPVTGTLTVGKSAQTANAPTFATVGVASASALASNANRTGLILVNTSTSTISIGIGAAAVLNRGITILPGAAFTMDAFSFFTGQIFAIAGVASSNLSIQEFQ